MTHPASQCPSCGTAPPPSVAGLRPCPHCGQPLVVLPSSRGEEAACLTPQLGPLRLLEPVSPPSAEVLFRGEDVAQKRPVMVRLYPGYAAAPAAAREELDRTIAWLQTVESPHLMRLLLHGTERGVRYVAEEHPPGDSLAVILDDCRSGSRVMPFDYAYPYFRQMCLGLAALHERGLAHRRLRPERILVSPERQVRLALPEMGSLLAGAAAPVSRDVYSPPEGIAQKDLEDPRADIYTLGVVTYEMLTGYVPGAVARRPSILNPTVPEWFDRLTLWMLEKSPEDRPAGVSALLEAARPGGTPLNVDRLANILGGGVVGAIFGAVTAHFMGGELLYGALAGVLPGLLAGAFFAPTTKPGHGPRDEAGTPLPGPGDGIRSGMGPGPSSSPDPDDRIRPRG